MVRVVLFTGGRGSTALGERLSTDPEIQLTVAVNGYDDGASTGRVRRFLGDCLGPSDFRKNGARLAKLRKSCPPALIELLDYRLPVSCTPEDAEAALRIVSEPAAPGPDGGAAAAVRRLAAQLPPEHRAACWTRLERFMGEIRATGRAFDYSDCAIGNLVFGGGFLLRGRRFNDAVDDYAALLGVEPGVIVDVTDGTNAWLVALDDRGEFLSTEEAIVDARHAHRVAEIFLLPEPLAPADEGALGALPVESRAAFLEARSARIAANPLLLERLGAADLIVYAPGTQHSSLFPSYLAIGVSHAVSANLTATKLLVTNIQPDAEIAGRSAVDIVGRAAYYLEDKGRLRIPTPALITHCLINEPAGENGPRVPTGRLDTIDDPRLVRVAHFEDGVTGRHDAEKVLGPFVAAFLERQRPSRVGVVLHNADSVNKLTQTLLEMIRGGLTHLPVELLVVHGGAEAVPPEFARHLPFPVRHVAAEDSAWDRAVIAELDAWGADFVVLFDSSGMYRGEDVRGLVAPLVAGRSDAVWGSRRLSPREIDESYRLRYRHNVLLGAVSFLGSHVLSLAYLLLYGRYVSDTLSGGRAIRQAFYRESGARVAELRGNHRLLALLLQSRGTFHEAPLRFVPLSPDRVKRPTVAEALLSLLRIVWYRLQPAMAARARRLGQVR